MSNSYQLNKMTVSIIAVAVVLGSFLYFLSSGGNTDKQQAASLLAPPKTVSSRSVINFLEAPDHIGEHVVISGLVDNVFISNKGTNFLNFCQNYKTCQFSAVIFNSDVYKFSNVRAYEGRIVEISGTITTYQGRAQIIIKDPSQIKWK